MSVLFCSVLFYFQNSLLTIRWLFSSQDIHIRNHLFAVTHQVCWRYFLSLTCFWFPMNGEFQRKSFANRLFYTPIWVQEWIHLNAFDKVSDLFVHLSSKHILSQWTPHPRQKVCSIKHLVFVVDTSLERKLDVCLRNGGNSGIVNTTSTDFLIVSSRFSLCSFLSSWPENYVKLWKRASKNSTAHRSVASCVLALPFDFLLNKFPNQLTEVCLV